MKKQKPDIRRMGSQQQSDIAPKIPPVQKKEIRGTGQNPKKGNPPR